MRLRAHHLLCILGFRGLGYDEKFIKKMESVIQRIKEQPDLGIEIIKECDDICAACPFNVEGFCRNEVVEGEETVRGKDQVVVERLELKERKKYNLKEILNSIKKKIKSGDFIAGFAYYIAEFYGGKCNIIPRDGLPKGSICYRSVKVLD